MTHRIRRVAVLGAGTMGAAIAAHCANAGLEVDLLDIASQDDEDKNAVVKAGFERMKDARPAALMDEDVAARISIGNFEDDFDRVGEADWILEAIIEKLEPKQRLMERVEATAREDAIVSSNTSGIPLHRLAEGRGEGFRRRLLGTHFFNPPRYLKLLEIIPTEETDPEIVEFMRNVGERVLGKGGVIAKDTPNFIGNRLWSFTGMQSVRYALENGYGIEEVDAITGPLIGRPKTATFRLNDQVGLDIVVGVAENLIAATPEDESHGEIEPHPKLKEMLDKNLLGNKAGAGFYKRSRRDGKNVFEVLDLETFEHHALQNPEIPIATQAWKLEGLGARLRFLIEKGEEDRHARYIRDTLLPYLAYASRRVPEISDTLEDVDHAMEWGFAHQTGPFRTWNLLGARDTVEKMDDLGIVVGPWVREMLDGGNESFYKEEDGRELQFSPAKRRYEPVRVDRMEISLDKLREEGKELARNDSASLLDLGEGVLCLELHSRGNSMDASVVEMGYRALEELEGGEWAGLVIGNEGRNFCAGADLGEISRAARSGALDEVARILDALQGLLMGFRFASKPVVAAPRGQTLGAGLEVCLHVDRVVAAGGTYMGLVEARVGLVPAAGGTKEMARRTVSRPLSIAPDAAPLPFLQKAFETIAMAKTSASALEARNLGFLDEDDRVVMNADHALSAAKREVLALADGYAPPERGRNVYAAGKAVRATLEAAVKSQEEWGQYDGVIAGHIARILTGGDLPAPQWVPEEHLLKLEKEAFLDLLKNEKTRERIGHMLETGKPLRN